LVLLDQEVSNPGLEITELKKHLGWLFLYRDDIEHWKRLVSIGVAARQVVRIEGIHINIVESFEQSISSVALSNREMYFVNQLTQFLQNQSNGIEYGKSFLGSTEVLESLFGKIKYMEREQRAFGFTSLLLAAIASVGTLDDATIIEAIKSVKLADIEMWAKTEIGQSVQSQRRQIKRIVAGLVTKVFKKVGLKVSDILYANAA
jgi:hypothetical protein